jgi:hypothetical protein
MSISHSPKSDNRFSPQVNRPAQPQKTASPAVFLLRQTAFIHNPVLQPWLPVRSAAGECLQKSEVRSAD